MAEEWISRNTAQHFFRYSRRRDNAMSETKWDFCLDHQAEKTISGEVLHTVVTISEATLIDPRTPSHLEARGLAHQNAHHPALPSTRNQPIRPQARYTFTSPDQQHAPAHQPSSPLHSRAQPSGAQDPGARDRSRRWTCPAQ